MSEIRFGGRCEKHCSALPCLACENLALQAALKERDAELERSKEPFGYVSEHNCQGPFQYQFHKDARSVYQDTCKSITAVYTAPVQADCASKPQESGAQDDLTGNGGAQEPCIMCGSTNGYVTYTCNECGQKIDGVDVRGAQERKPLTANQRNAAWHDHHNNPSIPSMACYAFHAGIRYAEAAHGIKEQP